MGHGSIICGIFLLIASVQSLPIKNDNPIVTDNLPTLEDEVRTMSVNDVLPQSEELIRVNDRSILRNTIRPGMLVSSYAVEIEPHVDDGTFSATAIIQVSITDQNTREDPIILHSVDLDIESVQFSLVGGTLLYDAEFDENDDDGLLEIETGVPGTLYRFVINYSGSLETAGQGIWAGHYGDNNYVAMNLHPTNARRVFPCLDEPTEPATISFTFNDIEYNNLISNSLLEDNSQNQFRALQGPTHLWGMIAHNFVQLNLPTPNVILMGRPGLTGQESQASLAINSFFNFLNEWTDKPYFEIIMNQAANLHIIALPDVDRDWHSLSTIGIWEPYLLMDMNGSVKQRKTVLIKIAEAIAKQWFGCVIFPENWQYEWVVSGLATYAAYEATKNTPVGLEDITLLDMNTLFVTDVIQESLLRDAYISAQPLEPGEDLFDEEAIRDNIYGLLKYKSPAIMHTLRYILGDDSQDFIHMAARVLLYTTSLQSVTSLSFVDAINSYWMAEGGPLLEEFDYDFLEPWILNTGYPLVTVGVRQGGIFLQQERFSFSTLPQITYDIPITYTTSVNPNFDDVQPQDLMDATLPINMVLDEEDWVLVNIQGQGYYRVNYEFELWERIIEALEDPERREVIHPLNRATLVDDALNLARTGRIDYDIAFRVVLTMEHETEYAVWKAFVRNMNFLRKRLVAMVEEDEDLDPDIYLRMVRRTIGLVEEEIGFYPEPLQSEPAMVSLTRGLMMDHACRANYQPCIAAAVDLFYDPNSNDPVVNPNIPHEIRPAVYCTMVREGDEEVIEALEARLEIEPSHYERVVILESLACSQDNDYILGLLEETVTPGNRFLVEERMKIFEAIVESSRTNALIAINFISNRAMEIQNMYGGVKKLEELIFVLAENMADNDLSMEFRIWATAQQNNLDDSQEIANRALAYVNENLTWDNRFLDYVYEWIDENDAPTLAVSLVLVGVTFMLTLFNH